MAGTLARRSSAPDDPKKVLIARKPGRQTPSVRLVQHCRGRGGAAVIASTDRKGQASTAFGACSKLRLHRNQSHDGSALETSERPDACLCELTLGETGVVAVAVHPDGPQPSQSGLTPEPGPTSTGPHGAESRSATTASSDRIAAGWFEARPGWCLRARGSDQGFLPIETGKYLMLRRARGVSFSVA